VFAPGHIGELTRIVPFEMVDQVLAETRALERRVWLVPARVTVYLLLAAALFTGLGHRQMLDRLCAGLTGLTPVRPSGSAWPGQGPVQGLLAQAEGVFDVEAPDVGAPQ
jgi:hypothetical protein